MNSSRIAVGELYAYIYYSVLVRCAVVCTHVRLSACTAHSVRSVAAYAATDERHSAQTDATQLWDQLALV